MTNFSYQNQFYQMETGTEAMLCVNGDGVRQVLPFPVFEIGGVARAEGYVFSGSVSERKMANGCTEYILSYTGKEPRLGALTLRVRVSDRSPIFRFQYQLTAADANPLVLTKRDGRDNITYTAVSAHRAQALTEIQFSQFIQHTHSYVPVFQPLYGLSDPSYPTRFAGPLAVAEADGQWMLLGYEHGAEYPDSYLEFVLEEGALKLSAKKGNYYGGMDCSGRNAFSSVWFQFGMGKGDMDALCEQYRQFVLYDMAEYGASRKPYIFYNTWHFQERGHNFDHKGYIETLTEQRVLREIEVAHQMGIEVFVIDTGWFLKTGDWTANPERFPNGMRAIKARLNEYGMQLGLWFNPIVAAETSEFVLKHPEYRMTIDGQCKSFSVWETEPSYGMCLCSDYQDQIAERFIQISKAWGVTYFKWDGIGQYGCDAPGHHHGGADNLPNERAECYSYSMGIAMLHVVEALCRECPEVIVDFDVTEAGRFVGLGFLSVGKYFLINNGPYAMDFDQPDPYGYLLEKPVPLDPWTNVFFYPGVARSRFCRQGARYDALIPSVLFLTHFIPNQSADAVGRENALASLVLGGNGIWGDLTTLPPEDVAYYHTQLGYYKNIRQEATGTRPRVIGEIGSSPEIHEKIDPASAKGLICLFTHKSGVIQYVTRPLEKAPSSVIGADSYEILSSGALLLRVSLNENGAATIFIGA